MRTIIGNKEFYDAIDDYIVYSTLYRTAVEGLFLKDVVVDVEKHAFFSNFLGDRCIFQNCTFLGNMFTSFKAVTFNLCTVRDCSFQFCGSVTNIDSNLFYSKLYRVGAFRISGGNSVINNISVENEYQIIILPGKYNNVNIYNSSFSCEKMLLDFSSIDKKCKLNIQNNKFPEKLHSRVDSIEGHEELNNMLKLNGSIDFETSVSIYTTDFSKVIPFKYIYATHVVLIGCDLKGFDLTKIKAGNIYCRKCKIDESTNIGDMPVRYGTFEIGNSVTFEIKGNRY